MYFPQFNLQYFRSHLPNDDLASWDILKAAAQTEDAIGAVLRAHLFCEQIITVWISSSCCINVLDKTRLSFSQKLQMAQNMRLSAPVCGIMKSINSIRNDLAHTYHFELTENHPTFIKLVNQFLEIIRLEREHWSDNPGLAFFDESAQQQICLQWQDELPVHQRITLIAALLFHHIFKQAEILSPHTS